MSALEPVNTVLKAVDRLNVRKGDLVPVFGQGPIGLMFTQLLKVRGARPVGLDLISSRRKLSTRLGAAWSADPREPSFERRLRKETDAKAAGIVKEADTRANSLVAEAKKKAAATP